MCVSLKKNAMGYSFSFIYQRCKVGDNLDWKDSICRYLNHRFIATVYYDIVIIHLFIEVLLLNEVFKLNQ